ncbi:MAG: peptidase domain-containing ABC transporter, partial [Nostocaceae cyanobacterium]|nr:peptidase domain-containing ABC transporter [Nostocaceae cyanobacterium]
ASPGIIVEIPQSQLEVWLAIPKLQAFLHKQTKERQSLIFFKTCTELSLSSQTLGQLLPYIEEIRFSAGASISSIHGRFWLRSGQIQSSSNQVQIGQSWESPGIDDWLAETDLLVYQLPPEHLPMAAAIAPDLFNHEPGQTQTTALPPTRPRSQVIRVPPKTEPEKPNNESLEVEFPQPTRRRIKSWLWPKYPFIEQQSSSDCGAACLAMISQYWGKRFSLNRLRNLAGVDRVGASLKGLAQAAEALGYHARPVRASLSKVELQENPWIAHWEGVHYVVVWRVKGDRVLICDPAIGKRSLSRQEFKEGWTGYALLLNPTERLDATKNEQLSLNRFWSAFWPYRSVLGQIITASVLLQIFGLVTPLFTQIILDQVVVQKSATSLNVFCIGLLIFSVWRLGLTSVRQYLLDYFSNRMDLTFISGFISHTLMLPLQFFESRQVGDIITRVQENQKIQLFLTRQAVSAWLDSLTAVFYVGLMLYYNFQLAILVLALIPPIVILTVIASPFLRGVSREIFKESAGQNSSMVEMMTGISTVKTVAAEREVRWRWEEKFTSMLNSRFRGQKLANGLQVTSGLINAIGSTALLWYGASLVIQDQLTIGQLVAFNMMIGNVIGPVLALVGLWDELQEVLVSVERLNDVFAAEPEESPQKPLLLLPPIRGEVQFENVTFRYNLDEEQNILQNISFQVSVGQTVALVGRSGSGKSTLVSLLQGLYKPSKGRIWLDGHDLSHVSPRSLRSQLGVVPQECFLFSGTIMENISLYSDEFSLEQVVEAAKLAEAHAFIQALPMGYNTQVGERGSSLSGGQRQRIAIARAVLRSPRILILDEATSALDTESERRFQENLSRISRDRTTFIIAHRLSTVKNADSILVLDKGIVVEQGSHVQLMAQQGLYYHLAQQQL